MTTQQAEKPSLFKIENDNILEVTDLTFDEEVFEAATPVLVLFGAERCAQCKEMLPDIEDIATERKGSLKACWVEIDRYDSVAKRMRIKGIPNLLLFKDGAMESRLGGVQSSEDVEEWLDENI